MKRKSLLFLLLMALFAPLGMMGQSTLTMTVYENETATNNYIPLYGYDGDYYQKTEFVIPASELIALNGKAITQMAFYISGSNPTKVWGPFQVFLKEVNFTTISAWQGDSGATTVYTGTFDGTSGTVTVAFNGNTPTYTYNGGNLLVGVYLTTTDGQWNSASFYGKNVEGASGNGYDNSSLASCSFSQKNFVPRTTFTYLTSDPSIVLNPTSATVMTGFSQTLTASTLNVTGTPTITYTSSNTTVATVSGSGTTATVTGVAPGTATITASMTYQGTTYTATCAITVEDPHACTPTLTSTTTTYYISNFTTTDATTNINSTTTGAGASYSDFYSSYSASASAGQTINFTITIAGGGTHGSAIWVDWNDDLEFSDAERVHQTSSYSYSPHSGSFTVPANATAGDHRMRVVSDYNNSTPSDPCSATTGEFEDYKLTVSSDPYIVLAPTAATVFTGFTETLTATYGNVSGTPTITYYSSNTSVATVSGSGTTATVTGVAPGTATITASMTVSGTTYTATSEITVENPSYCTPGTGNYDNDGISNVTFGTNGVVVNNTVGGINYGDYSNLVGAVDAGTTCQVDITYKTGYTYGTIIWVDWNKNYTFEGTEAVYAGNSGSANPTTLNATFDIPVTTQAGDYRMRIIGADQALDSYISSLSAAASVDACGTFNWSTCHDYTLRVIPASTEPSIALAPETATLSLGSTLALTATVRNVSDPTITYTSSDNGIATVSGSGTTATVTSVAEGTVTITATMTVSGTTYTATSTITIQDTPLRSSNGNYYTWEYFAANPRSCGSTIYLERDITVSTIVTGSCWTTSTGFNGTFDGQGHTITINHTATQDHTGLFRYTYGATIKNLRLEGTINSNLSNTASFIGLSQASTYIENCISNVTINSTAETGVAGMVGEASNSITFRGCAFIGTLNGSSSSRNGGFVGYQYNNGSHSFINCLFAPTSVSSTLTNGYTFDEYNSSEDTHNSTFTNSYYTESFGTAQGKQAYSVTGISPVTVARSGNASNTYNASGIAAYSTGLNFTNNDVTIIYAGNNDNITLNLGYTGEGTVNQYTHNDIAFTDDSNPYSLTMPNENVVIAANISFTKVIEAYGNSERGGYYFIASPVGTVTPSADNGFLRGTYDLYYFDQNAWDDVNDESVLLEWRNYDVEPFSIASGTGYLYANKEGTTLTFTGTPYNGNGVVSLSKIEGPRFSGWNLVGNPFAQTAYFTNDFYTLNEDRDEVVAGTTKRVEAMEGIFVVAANNGETMTFSTTPLGKSNSQMSINVVRNRGNVIDRAIVRFDEESLLPKFQLNPNHTKVYIPQDGSDYAVVYADGAGTMPVNFKAEKNGHYTLNFTTENVNFNYLHLIDNRNGNDVDLLQTPYYTFDAKSTDYASRFTLVFATGNDNDGNFAFFNNGVWIINNDGKAELQVVDALGRILSSETISGSCSKAINAAPGVYMLRLINGNNVKVQKIVVRR